MSDFFFQNCHPIEAGIEKAGHLVCEPVRDLGHALPRVSRTLRLATQVRHCAAPPNLDQAATCETALDIDPSRARWAWNPAVLNETAIRLRTEKSEEIEHNPHSLSHVHTTLQDR
jgi:hypothetical protein